MFDIEYKGGNCVVISTKKTTLVFDPKLSMFGLKDYAVKDAVELNTEDRFSINNSDAKLSIKVAGEYGVGDVDILAIPMQRHLDSADVSLSSVAYRLLIGDNRVAVLGNVYEKISDDQLESLGLIDILILPVGGNGYTLDADGAMNIIGKIEPKVVIPVHYDDKSLKYEVPQASLDDFLAKSGMEVEKTSKYKLKNNFVFPSKLTAIVVERS